ncbi:MAG: hypothetical protein L6Q97_20355, partial [Thermoanaerobaculia bacterium]|nr:hypothetical protein [Thermoanaerobaculia bacterium]
TSCNTLEKASLHGFNSGYYKVKSRQKNDQNVYADVTEEKIDIYHQTRNQPDKLAFLSIPLKPSDSLVFSPMVFKKNSLDIDLTAVPLKYRPSVYGLPGQMATDFNIALYAGWRYDSYIIKSRKDPLGKRYPKIINRGYDFGVFAGTGSTLISPFTTQNKRTDEYTGLMIQTGFAGFIESSIASFGLATGFDYLMNPDRKVWIYNNKPWVGFIVGIALN